MICQTYFLGIYLYMNIRLFKLLNLCAMLLVLLSMHTHTHWDTCSPKPSVSSRLASGSSEQPAVLTSCTQVWNTRAAWVPTTRLYKFGWNQISTGRVNSTLGANSSPGFWQSNDPRTLNVIMCAERKCHPKAQKNCSMRFCFFFLIRVEIKKNKTAIYFALMMHFGKK